MLNLRLNCINVVDQRSKLSSSARNLGVVFLSIFLSLNDYILKICKSAQFVWNRAFMIAPVKKFGRVRLSTNFPWKQIWRRMQTSKDDEFLLGFKFSSAQRHQAKVFMNCFNGIFGHQAGRDVCTVHWWLHLSWFGISASSVIYKLREFPSDQPAPSLIFFYLQWH